jgi:hypothetical protein
LRRSGAATSALGKDEINRILLMGDRGFEPRSLCQRVCLTSEFHRHRRRCDGRRRCVADHGHRASDGGTANPDPTLIKLIVRVYVFRDKLLQSGGKRVAADEPRPSSSVLPETVVAIAMEWFAAQSKC